MLAPLLLLACAHLSPFPSPRVDYGEGPVELALVTVPEELYDASTVDGANAWQRFRHIYLPLTSPGIVAGCLIVFLPAMGMFYVADLLGRTDEARTELEAFEELALKELGKLDE